MDQVSVGRSTKISPLKEGEVRALCASHGACLLLAARYHAFLPD